MPRVIADGFALSCDSPGCEAQARWTVGDCSLCLTHAVRAERGAPDPVVQRLADLAALAIGMQAVTLLRLPPSAFRSDYWQLSVPDVIRDAAPAAEGRRRSPNSKWTDERRAVVALRFPRGDSESDIAAEVNALPGRTISVSAIRPYAYAMGLSREVRKPRASSATPRSLVKSEHAGPRRKDYPFARQTRFALSAHQHVDRRDAALPAHHRAVIEGRTLFPASVRDASEVKNVLVSGHNSAKIGRIVQKGPWAGMPIYMLTLEERATCPRSCSVWKECFAPGTPVLTAELRWVPIETLGAGDRIAAFDEYPDEGTGRRRSKIAVVEAVGTAIRKSYRILTDRGEVTASAAHEWVARKDRRGYRWFRTDELAPGDSIHFLAEPWQTDFSYDAGRVRGFVEGEGYVGAWGNGGFPKPRVGWAQRPGTLIDQINSIVRERGFDLACSELTSGAAGNLVTHNDVAGGWREVLRFLGVFRPNRLIERAEEVYAGHVFDGRGAIPAKVLEVEPVGEIEVITIATSTKTLIANGFLAHNCYGKGAPHAQRIRYTPDLMARLDAELRYFAMLNPHGFVVRLHQLGDFPDEIYVARWNNWLAEIPELHLFGYTAHSDESRIRAGIATMNAAYPERCAIRFSVPAAAAGADAWMQTTVIWHDVGTATEVAEGTICPQQLGRTECCATCGLCWAPAAYRKRIVFLGHGRLGKHPRFAPMEIEHAA